MELVAKKVLADLEAAHLMLEDEESVKRFRVLWVAAVSLARAVGHVLEKKDAKQSSKHHKIIHDMYRLWKSNMDEHAIFFHFIKDERDSVLKEYEIGFLSGSTNVLLVPNNEIFELKDNLFCPLISGKYAGEDCRDVLKLAIDWWKEQIDCIEKGL